MMTMLLMNMVGVETPAAPPPPSSVPLLLLPQASTDVSGCPWKLLGAYLNDAAVSYTEYDEALVARVPTLWQGEVSGLCVVAVVVVVGVFSSTFLLGLVVGGGCFFFFVPLSSSRGGRGNHRPRLAAATS